MIKNNISEVALVGKFLLIDAAQVPILIQDFEAKNKRFAINLFSLLHSKEENIPNMYSPLLVQITSQNQNNLLELVYEITERKSQRSISIISSKLSYIGLSNQLSKFLIISDENKFEYLLRFYDTEVLPTLLEILTKEQAQLLLENIDDWYIYSEDSFTNLVKIEHKKENKLEISNILLTQTQLELLDTSIFRRILNQLQVEKGKEYDELLNLAQKAYLEYSVVQIDDMEIFLEIAHEMKLHKNNTLQLSKIMENTSLSINEKLFELERL